MGSINNVLCVHTIESSEQSVIEHLEEFKAIGFERLGAAAQQLGVLTNTHLETFEDAPNNVKKLEIIINALMSLPKPELIHFTVLLATQGIIIASYVTTVVPTGSLLYIVVLASL